MKEKDRFDAIYQTVQKLDAAKTHDLVEEAVAAGCAPLDIINRGLTPAIQEIGRRFESGELYLPHLMVAAEIVGAETKILSARMEKRERKTAAGKVLIGCVEGDLHDLGKNLIVTMLKLNEIEVIDLGRDVPADKFVQAVRERKPDFVYLSALMTTTMANQSSAIDALKREGLRDQVKVVVGGAPITREFAVKIGADAYGADAADAVRIAVGKRE